MEKTWNRPLTFYSENSEEDDNNCFFSYGFQFKRSGQIVGLPCLKTLCGPLFFLTLLLSVVSLNGQSRSFEGYQDPSIAPYLYQEQFQWAIGLRLNSVLIKQNQSEFYLSIVGAMGGALGEKEFNSNMNWLYPSLQMEFLLMRGGLGSALGTKEYTQWSPELRTGILMTYGLSQQARTVARPIPLTVTNSARVLDDPYFFSIRLGTVYIWNFKRGWKQRMGNFGIGYGSVSFDYNNDGAAIHGWFHLGDEYDRWHTGSGELSFYASGPHTAFNRLSLTFARFTGFSPYSYEASSKLGLPYVAYPKLKEQLLNQGRWIIAGEFRNGLRAEFQILDQPFIEVQNIIHWGSGRMALHPSALQTRFGFGVGYMNRYVESNE